MRPALMKRISSFAYCVLIVLLCSVVSSGQTQIDNAAAQPPAPITTIQANQVTIQSPEAKEMADEIGLGSLLIRFNSLPDNKKCGNEAADAFEALIIRQGITEALLEASLETDHVLGDIDNELMHIRMTRDVLQSRQDRFSKISNVAAIISSGALGVIGTAFQFKDSTANAGNAISIAGNGASVVLSLLGLRQLKGGERLSPEVPTMLAEPLNAEDVGGANDIYGRETSVVWRYLNAVPPTVATGSETRLQKLKDGWAERGLLGESRNRSKRIQQLTSGGDKQPKLSIEVLDARTAMLIDLHAQVSMMKHSMSKLMQEMKQVFVCGEK